MKYSEKNELERMTSKELVILYNTMAENPIVKFRDRSTAIRRIINLLPYDKEEKVIGKPEPKSDYLTWSMKQGEVSWLKRKQ